MKQNKKSDIAEDKLEKSKDEKPKRLGNHLDYSAHDKDLSNSGYQQKNYNPYSKYFNFFFFILKIKLQQHKSIQIIIKKLNLLQLIIINIPILMIENII